MGDGKGENSVTSTFCPRGAFGLAWIMAVCAAPLHLLFAQEITTIVRAAVPPDSVSGAPTPGRIAVALRDVDRPFVSLTEATITLRPAGVDSAATSQIRHLRVSGPMSSWLNVRPGPYLLRAARPGFAAVTINLTVLGNCETDVEIYMMRMANCLTKCESTPARATVTTCAPTVTSRSGT